MSNIALQIERQAAGTISSATNVIFDTIKHLSGGISYNRGTGVITFNETGRFLLNWWVATQTAQTSNGLVFALSTSQGDYLKGDTPNITGEIVGTGIIDITSTPVTASLVNGSTGTVFYSAIVPLKATLVIMQDNLGSTGPTGPIGPPGPTGPTGNTGPTGPAVTTLGYVFNPATTESAIALGSNIVFQNNGPLNGITHTAGTAQITVPDTANYMIGYSVAITRNINASILIAVNGAVVASTETPTQTHPGEYSDLSILALNAGDIVTLRVK